MGFYFLFEYKDFIMNTVGFRIDTIHGTYRIGFEATALEHRFHKIRTKMLSKYSRHYLIQNNNCKKYIARKVRNVPILEINQCFQNSKTTSVRTRTCDHLLPANATRFRRLNAKNQLSSTVGAYQQLNQSPADNVIGTRHDRIW